MIVCDLLLLYVGGGVVVRSAFIMRIHTFLYTHFFTTQFSFLLLNVVLIFVVNFLLQRFVVAEFFS